jgi:hypothetical protein
MGVLDDAIREHLELKRRHGASEEEISRAEAEALTPARRPAADETPGRLAVEPVDDVAPPPVERSAGTHAVHDIDEDPLAPPAPVDRSTVDEATVETDAVDRPDGGDSLRPPGRLSE